MYDYYASVKTDILTHITENYTVDYLIDNLEDVETFIQDLEDDCWADDSVTGNASGSYFCNCQEAKQAVIDNFELLFECFSEFCYDAKQIGKLFIAQSWETMDVIIRCYILYDCCERIVTALKECSEILKILAIENHELSQPMLASLIAA